MTRSIRSRLPRCTETQRRATLAVYGKAAIRATRLTNFRGRCAVFVHDGCAHDAVMTREGWVLTGTYTYVGR